jgi:hypothetical protein
MAMIASAPHLRGVLDHALVGVLAGGLAHLRQQRGRVVLGVDRLREFDDRRQPLFNCPENAHPGCKHLI